jgi:hypothetical protein
MLARVRIRAALVQVSLLLCVVGCADREASEARLLVSRAGAIDPYADVEDRRARVDALAALALESDGARGVRDTCVEAHRKLLEAEDASARAREALARSERGEAELTPTEAAAVGRTIAQSNAALAEAGEQLPECQARVAELASRHGIRR